MSSKTSNPVPNWASCSMPTRPPPEVYENMNYQHAGLCRSALDVSLAAEGAAKEAIARAMRGDESNKDKMHGQG